MKVEDADSMTSGFPYFRYHFSDQFECSDASDCPSCGKDNSDVNGDFDCTMTHRGGIVTVCEDNKCGVKDSCSRAPCSSEPEDTCIPWSKGGHSCSATHAGVPQCVYENCNTEWVTSFLSDFYPNMDDACTKITELETCALEHCDGISMPGEDGTDVVLNEYLSSKLSEKKKCFCNGDCFPACYNVCLPNSEVAGSVFEMPSVQPAGIDRDKCMDLGDFDSCSQSEEVQNSCGATKEERDTKKAILRQSSAALSTCYCNGICERPVEGTCAAGEYLSSPSNTCATCEAGWFLSNFAGKNKYTACVPCPAGTYQDSAGQTACIPCDPGTFSSVFHDREGITSCTACPTGSSSPRGATSCSSGPSDDETDGDDGVPTCISDAACNLDSMTFPSNDPGIDGRADLCVSVELLEGCINTSGCSDGEKETFLEKVKPFDDCYCEDLGCPEGGGSGGGGDDTPDIDIPTCITDKGCSIDFEMPADISTATPTALISICNEITTFESCVSSSSCSEDIKNTMTRDLNLETTKCLLGCGGDCPDGSDGGNSGSCPAGSQCNENGEVLFVCPVGQYSGIGDRQCMQCSAGKTALYTGSESCTLCPAGTYQDSAGQSACIPCNPGTFSADSGNDSENACYVCAANQYSPMAGSTSCINCADGTASPTGATSCSTCPAGYECADGETTACPVGQYSSEDEPCMDCPEGYYCPGGEY